ncbi:GMC family oxidoreductase [Patulibacter defluvii]|uniref:GMC family oxidoreductase n=1 Tax=Patulibacter defluvii TaxID=3095358 RepID=UPI002A763ECB|nr:GMC family oxidoreductase [Patulibacter sp. DM4]
MTAGSPAEPVRRRTASAPDVLVVGLGPAGLVATRVLAAAGLRVHALEAGPADPRRATSRSALVAPAPTIAGRPDRPAPGPPAGLNAVGGAKQLAAAQSYRLDPWTHVARSASLRRYGRDALPAGSTVADWPLAAAELAPFHDRIEALLEVDGERAPDERDAPPLAPPRARGDWTARMADAARDRGWRPFAAPATRTPDARGLLDPVRGRDQLTVETGAAATALLLGPDGDVVGVRVRRGSVEREHRARTVVLAGGVPENVRLLLLAATAGGPGGAALGRHFMAHNLLAVHGWFPGEDLGRDAGTAAEATAVAELDGDRFDHAGLGFLGGSIVQAAMSGPRGMAWRTGVAASLADPDAPPELRARDGIDRHGASIGTVWAQPEQLPRDDHRLELDGRRRDPLGRPVLLIHHGLADDDRRRAAFLMARMAEWLRAAGAARTWAAPPAPQPLGTHLYGGTRMGADPATAVVDGHGVAHGAPGLVVLGSSTFPTSGGRGPTQTIEALAWRAARRRAALLREG